MAKSGVEHLAAHPGWRTKRKRKPNPRAELLRSAASALEHGRHATVKRKLATFHGFELEDLYENIAAISAELHGDRKQYEAFYKRHADRVGGFPGIYRLCIDAAKVYAVAEVAAPYKHEWLEAIEDYVDGMFKLDYCSESELRELAERCIADRKTDMKEVQS